MQFRICSYLLFSALAAGCVDDVSEIVSELGAKKPRRPPKEAVEACAALTAGATCAFDHDGRHVEGKCRTAPDGNGPLACAPPPPLEALAACDSAAAGDACSFDFDGHHAEGTCKLSPEGAPPLACAPQRQ